MKPINVLQDIYSWVVDSKGLFTVNRDRNIGVISTLAGDLITPYYSESKLSPPSCSLETKGVYWVRDTKKSSIIYSDNQFQKKDYTVDSMFKDYAYIVTKEKDRATANLNINTDKIYWHKHPAFSPLSITADFCFHGYYQLTTLNNKTGEELWTYILPDTFNFIDFTSKKQTASISKILGVYKDNVWLLISNGSLLALNIKTGLQSAHIISPSFAKSFNSERQQNIKKHIDKNNYGIFNNSSDNVQLDVDKGVIFGFPYQSYAEVDLNDPNYPFTLWDIKDTLEDQKETDKPGFDSLKVGAWEENDVYVYDSFFDSNRFGVFDRTTRKIRWSEYFEGEDEGWGAIQDLKYAKGHLYIHAKVDKSLHIYKLEK